MTGPARPPATTYRLAPALGARMVGRSLVTLAVLVLAATLVGLVTGVGWRLAGWVSAAGIVLVAIWAWYLFRRAWAVRLTGQGYAVRLLGGVGVRSASWSEIDEVAAAGPAGRPWLVLHLRDGRTTRLPMAALAGDPDTFARDVRRRVRDAHSPADPADGPLPETPES
ncbi:MAG TPA: hypothetical protein VH228_11115 [Nocardioides sp.]|nr:hypothetical protein [Nocardioides sp.]